MSTVQRYISAFKGDQYVAMQQVNSELDQIRAVIGRPTSGFVDVPNGVIQSNPLTAVGPPQAQFAVVGIDGKFIIQIQDPQIGLPESANLASIYASAGLNPQFAPILHNLQSSTTVNFDNSSSLADYGISAQVGYTFQNPNVTLFWRLRSSFNGKTWNKWQIYSSALTCGPVGVASGTLRTAALSTVNGANTPTTQPLTATTGTPVNAATINVAAFVVQYPAPIGRVSYSSGSITPLLDATFYYVYCLDPTFSGGAKTYIASTSNPDVTSNDGIVFLGSITTPAHGGGGTGGNGGGGGPCFTGNTHVITKDGHKRISKIIAWVDEVLTQRGWRVVGRRIEHAGYSGPLRDMGNGELVTPDHCFWFHRMWREAMFIFTTEIPCLYGSVFNLEIEGDGSDEEQCYTLANGWIAHNVRK